VARTITVEIVGDASALQRSFDDAGKSTSKFGDALGKASKVAAVGLAGLAVGAKKVSDDASNLNESMNAVNVVFGESADKIHSFAKVAADEAGLSMRQFNELVTPVGASLINVGFSADKAADASVDLAKRAADMASVFNVDVSEALEAIQAGLRGEADPLEKFGVGLSDAAVTSKALTMGLAGTAKELDANDKAQARLKLIMEQSNRVAGDFKNTSGSLANQQRINAAEAENQRAKLGQGLLPVMQTLQGVIRTVTNVLGEHSTATTVAVAAAAALAVGVLAVNSALKVYQAGLVVARAAQVLFNAALLTNPLVLITAAIVALGVALVVAYQKSETFRNVVNAVFNAVKNAVGVAINLILGYVDKWLGGVQAMLEAAGRLPGIGGKFDKMAEGVDRARHKVRDLQGEIDRLRGKDVTVTVTTVHKTYHEEYRVPGVAGSRAEGGPVRARMPYLVGEKGPEIFVPKQSGAILPNGTVSEGAALRSIAAGHQAATAGVAEVHAHVYLDGREIYKTVQREAIRDAGRNR
jgi:hypothetical protein